MLKKSCIFSALAVFVLGLGVFLFSYSAQSKFNILIVGDSIGEGAGVSYYDNKWYKFLIPYFQKEYGKKVEITNISMGGNSSYAGYVRTKELVMEEEVDLILICYGQNDPDEDFSLYYEAMLRALERKWPEANMISILESSQREYTNKIQIIQELCEHYGVYVADTIKGFAESGQPYETLTDDGVHPNDAGQRIYYETVKAVIETLPNLQKNENKEAAKAVNELVEDFDTYQYISFEEFRQSDTLTWELQMDHVISGKLGVDYNRIVGANSFEIFLDELSVGKKEIDWSYGFDQRHIEVLAENCICVEKIQISFSSTEQADNFYGLIFTGGNY